MRLLFFNAALVSAVMLSSCTESPFLTKEEAEKTISGANTNRDPFHYVQNVVAIIDNDIYYFDSLDTEPRRLTNTPDDIKKNVKLSHDHSRIAYINASGNPVVIRSDNGVTITTLTQYNYIHQMDWAKDRLTLYMLIDREVVFYGDPLPVTQPASTYYFDEVPSFSMNSIGDQGYFIHLYNTSGKKLMYQSEDKSLKSEYQNFEGDLYDYIDFYDNKGNFMLGWNDSYEGGLSRIVCVQDYNFWAAYEWDYENMTTPDFNADQEILLYGTIEGGYAIKAVYLGTEAYEGSGAYDRLTKTLTEYTSQTKVYLDWVQ